VNQLFSVFDSAKVGNNPVAKLSVVGARTVAGQITASICWNNRAFWWLCLRGCGSWRGKPSTGPLASALTSQGLPTLFVSSRQGPHLTSRFPGECRPAATKIRRGPNRPPEWVRYRFTIGLGLRLF